VTRPALHRASQITRIGFLVEQGEVESACQPNSPIFLKTDHVSILPARPRDREGFACRLPKPLPSHRHPGRFPTRPELDRLNSLPGNAVGWIVLDPKLDLRVDVERGADGLGKAGNGVGDARTLVLGGFGGNDEDRPAGSNLT
jgi:hypothetical protein